MRYFQKGFNYSQDGPGNRLVIHLQGCNLHCPWCSNPEGMSFAGGKEISTEELLAEIVSCKRMFFDNGGVTFTGGECTLQKEALKEVLIGCRNNGINTAIETNGTCKYDADFFSYIDLLICDFKHYDEAKLQEAIGPVGGYKKNMIDYLQSGKAVLVRIPLIHKFNDSKEDAINFAEFFKDLPTSDARFEFLPYHEYGKTKWERLGEEYQMHDAFIAEGTIDLFERIFKSYNLVTVRT